MKKCWSFHLFMAFSIAIASLLWVSSSPSAIKAAGTITGNVFRDFNANGIDDSINEIGIAGITVTAYDSSGTEQGTTVTDSNGDYSLSTTGTGPYRIEFSTLPSGYHSSPQASGSASTVQFVPDGNSSGVNLGINHPEDYTPADTASIPLFASMWTGGGPSDDPARANQGATFRFMRGQAIQHDHEGHDQPIPHPLGDVIATTAQTGGTGAGAYDPNNNLIYLAAFAHRGVDYGPGADGVLGTSDDAGAIYIVNNDAPVLTGNLPTLTIPNAGPVFPTPRGIDGTQFGPGGSHVGQTCQTIASTNRPTSPVDWIRDSCAYDMAGKEGVGGMVIDREAGILYAVNLYDRHLYSFDISSGVAATIQTTIRDIGPLTGGNYPNCVNGEWRPFALNIYRGDIYLGGICSAEYSDAPMNLATANSFLSAHVYRLNDASSDTSAIEIYSQNLAYARELGMFTATTHVWLPWIDSFEKWLLWADNGITESYHGSPMLVDLSFDYRGNLILGFADRMTNQNLPLPPVVDENGAYSPLFYNSDINTQVPLVNDGDLRRACWVASPTGLQTLDGVSGDWHEENTPACPEGFEEFGSREFFIDTDTMEFAHMEMSNGFIAYLAGLNEVANTSLNPTSHPYYSGGVRFYDAGTGNPVQGFNLFSPYEGFVGLRGKGASMGDVEYLLPAAPIEIGNRVWLDINRNGRQDPDEPAIPGVTVTLHDASGTLIASAVTDANGNYIFSSGLGTSNTSFIYGINALTPNSDFTVRIDENQTALTGLSLTLPNYDPVNGDTNDSDGDPTINPGFATAPLTTGAAGHNNHTYDFGFYYTYSLGNRVWFDPNNNGVIDAGELGIDGVIVDLYLDADGDGVPDTALPLASMATANGGYYRFDDLLPGNYVVVLNPSNFSGAGALVDYISSTPTQADPNSDIDSDDNGIDNPDPATNGIRSGTVTLGPSEPLGESDLSPTGQGNVDDRANMTVDFGFYLTYSLGNRVWFDPNNNGLIDAGELGIDGVLVDLYLDVDGDGVPDSATPLASMLTADGGYYRFDDLLAGNYIVVINPSNFVSGGPLDSYLSSTPTQADPNTDIDSDDNGIDSPNPVTNGISSGTITLGPTEPLNESDLSPTGQGNADGRANMTVDFGFYIPSPTAINLLSFQAHANSQGILLSWQTALEWNTRGFHVYRSSNANRADAQRITTNLIIARGGSAGASYSWLDSNAQAGQNYYYWLEEHELDGNTQFYGPAQLQAGMSNNTHSMFIPFVSR